MEARTIRGAENRITINRLELFFCPVLICWVGGGRDEMKIWKIIATNERHDGRI